MFYLPDSFDWVSWHIADVPFNQQVNSSGGRESRGREGVFALPYQLMTLPALFLIFMDSLICCLNLSVFDVLMTALPQSIMGFTFLQKPLELAALRTTQQPQMFSDGTAAVRWCISSKQRHPVGPWGKPFVMFFFFLSTFPLDGDRGSLCKPAGLWTKVNSPCWEFHLVDCGPSLQFTAHALVFAKTLKFRLIRFLKVKMHNEMVYHIHIMLVLAGPKQNWQNKGQLLLKDKSHPKLADQWFKVIEIAKWKRNNLFCEPGVSSSTSTMGHCGKERRRSLRSKAPLQLAAPLTCWLRHSVSGGTKQVTLLIPADCI